MAEPMQAPSVEPIAGEVPEPVVAPKADETVAPEETPEKSVLSEELLKIPAIQAVIVGEPPAVSMDIKGSKNRDEIKLVAAHKDELLSSGMGFYRSMDGNRGVVFNALRLHPDDLKAADKSGQLLQIAPDFDALNAQVAKSGRNHPLTRAEAPTGALPISRSSSIAPQEGSGSLPLAPPPPASVSRKLAAQRMLNLQPGAPTSGPAPGAGRLANQILRPAV